VFKVKPGQTTSPRSNKFPEALQKFTKMFFCWLALGRLELPPHERCTRHPGPSQPASKGWLAIGHEREHSGHSATQPLSQPTLPFTQLIEYSLVPACIEYRLSRSHDSLGTTRLHCSEIDLGLQRKRLGWWCTCLCLLDCGDTLILSSRPEQTDLATRWRQFAWLQREPYPRTTTASTR
jgi:hypothetical protein